MSDDRATLAPGRGDALVVVDVQVDFLPGGALGIEGGDRIIAPLNRYLRWFHDLGLPVFASRDWHTPDHCSFAAQGGPWPEHCVAGTRGAELSARLELPPGTQIIDKATAPDRDAYSTLEGTDLARRLRQAGIRRLYIGGLATDYCVVNTVRDAIGLGFEAVVLEDAICAVDVQPGDGDRAVEDMRRLGAAFARLGELAPEVATC